MKIMSWNGKDEFAEGYNSVILEWYMTCSRLWLKQLLLSQSKLLMKNMVVV